MGCCKQHCQIVIQRTHLEAKFCSEDIEVECYTHSFKDTCDVTRLADITRVNETFLLS